MCFTCGHLIHCRYRIFCTCGAEAHLQDIQLAVRGSGGKRDSLNVGAFVCERCEKVFFSMETLEEIMGHAGPAEDGDDDQPASEKE